MQIEEALAQYEVQLEANGRSQHTVGQARRHVRLFSGWLGERAVEQVEHEDVARFLASSAVRQRADGGIRKATSANAVRSSLRSFFAFVHGAGYAPTNPARLVRRAMAPAPPPKALSDGAVAKLLAAVSGHPRDHALVLVMLRCGLRLGSALGLDVEDVGDRDVRVRCLKGGGERLVPVPDAVATALRDLIGSRRSGPVFRSAHGTRLGARHTRRRIQDWARAAGIGAAHPHQLRHTLGTAVYRKTGDLLLTGKVLGHRTVSSTQVYASVADEAVRAAIAG